MLQGRLIQLRPVRETDLDAMYAAHVNISDRGPYFPLGVLSESAFRRWDAFELSYQLYGDSFAGRGYSTEAVQLVVDYLFATKKQHRIHLVIVPENAASIRVAEKCGFVLEGTVRGAFFNQGQNQDVLLYSLLRTDPRPWRESS